MKGPSSSVFELHALFAASLAQAVAGLAEEWGIYSTRTSFTFYEAVAHFEASAMAISDAEGRACQRKDI